MTGVRTTTSPDVAMTCTLTVRTIVLWWLAFRYQFHNEKNLYHQVQVNLNRQQSCTNIKYNYDDLKRKLMVDSDNCSPPQTVAAARRSIKHSPAISVKLRMYYICSIFKRHLKKHLLSEFVWYCLIIKCCHSFTMLSRLLISLSLYLQHTDVYLRGQSTFRMLTPVSYTHLTLPTKRIV